PISSSPSPCMPIKYYTFATNKLNQDVFVGGSGFLRHIRDGNVTSTYYYSGRRCRRHHGENDTTPEEPECWSDEVRAEQVLVDLRNQLVLVCGEPGTGFCWRHALHDICADVQRLADPARGRVYSPLSTVATVDEDEGTYYMGRTLDATVSLDEQRSMSEMSFGTGNFSLVAESADKRLRSSLTVDEQRFGTYPLHFAAVFRRGDFVYYVFTETTRPPRGKKRPKYAVKIARMCVRPRSFGRWSYVELRLTCAVSEQKRKNKNLMAVHSRLVHTRDVLAYQTGHYTDHYVVTLFKIVRVDGDDSEKLVCMHSLDDIDFEMDEAIRLCNTYASPPVRNTVTAFLYQGDSYPYGDCANDPDKTTPDLTFCPTVSESNLVHTIGASRAVNETDAFNYFNYQDTDHHSPNFTALDVRDDVDSATRMLIGSEHGRLYLHSFDHHNDRFVFPHIAVGAGPVRKVDYLGRDAGARVLTESGGYRRVSLDEFCAAASSCGECLTLKKFAQCGFCQSTLTCTRDPSSCPEKLATETCYSEVTRVEPQRGPVEGLTSLVVTGRQLSCRDWRDTRPYDLWGNSAGGGPVRVAKCKVVDVNRLECNSLQVGQTFSSRLFLRRNLTCNEATYVGGREPRSLFGADDDAAAANFTFIRVRVDKRFSPDYGAQSGGTVIRITGSHLNSTSGVEIIIAGRNCSVRTRYFDEITCEIARPCGEGCDTSVSMIRLDGMRSDFETRFRFRPDPVIDDFVDYDEFNGIRGIIRFVFSAALIQVVQSIKILHGSMSLGYLDWCEKVIARQDRPSRIASS
ncbi:MAG: IPT/TIG domain-containing protein, partial [Planctomycetota bacterium]